MNWFTKEHEFKITFPTWAWCIMGFMWCILGFMLFVSTYGQIRTAIDWGDDKKEMISELLETEEGREALAKMLIEQPGR